ncbi:MAG: DNA polymerase III subunit gamma/tau [Pseudomonadales bacterium]
MSYQVLARKWRPASFHEMVGQEHVLQALINALDSDRLHHAYLFTGTRGVGKTSVARILAKCLNCEAGISSTPCGECSACTEIATGRFVDLQEVDAASRTKVEDTRDLLDNVQYAPAKGRFKVYLIDEVHMLSGHSFNALLKTLEEPPPHVKFLLATTDPQKLPATILSRCLQFSLKNLPPQLIVEHLQSILEQEQVAFETPALWHLARAAAGSMRDALSLTDQAVAFCSSSLEEAPVRQMLGSIDHSKILELVNVLCAQDAAAMLRLVAALDQHGPDYEALLSELLSVLHQISLLQAVPDYTDPNSAYAEELPAIAAQLGAEDVQLFYQIGLNGIRDMPYAPDSRTGFEMSLLRMLAFRPDSGQFEEAESVQAKKKPRKLAVAPPSESRESVAQEPSAKPLAAHSGQMAAAEPDPGAKESQPKGSGVTVERTLPAFAPPDWIKLYEQLQLHGMAKNVAANCVLLENSEGRLRFALDAQNCQIFKPAHRKQIEKALCQHFGVELCVSIEADEVETESPYKYGQRIKQERQQHAVDCILNDPNVNELIDKFDASVIMESITPNDASEK